MTELDVSRDTGLSLAVVCFAQEANAHRDYKWGLLLGYAWERS